MRSGCFFGGLFLSFVVLQNKKFSLCRSFISKNFLIILWKSIFVFLLLFGLNFLSPSYVLRCFWCRIYFFQCVNVCSNMKSFILTKKTFESKVNNDRKYKKYRKKVQRYRQYEPFANILCRKRKRRRRRSCCFCNLKAFSTKFSFLRLFFFFILFHHRRHHHQLLSFRLPLIHLQNTSSTHTYVVRCI